LVRFFRAGFFRSATGRSLRVRLLLAAAVSIAVALLAAWAGFTELFERHVERRVEAQLDSYLSTIIAHLGIGPEGRVHFDQPLVEPRFQTPLSGLYWQIRDEDRPTLLRSRSLWDGELKLPDDVPPDGEAHRHDQPGPDGAPLLVLERQVVIRPELEPRRLRVAVGIARSDVTGARNAFAADMLPYLALLGVGLGLAAWVQVRVGLAPLDQVRQGVRAIRSGDTRRLPADFPEEVMPLTEEVNALLDAQDQAIDRARTWTADLAHGLKTPLVVLAADAERLRAQGQTALADDLDDLAQGMRRRVDRELIRARVRARSGERGGLAVGSDGAPGHPASDLADTLSKVVRALKRTPDGSALDWAFDCSQPTPVALLPEDLAELLGNLLENATQWAKSRVAIRVSTDDPRVLSLNVEDDGPGVPDDWLPELGQRGLRLDRRTPGSGLGLAIAQDICDGYGGEIAFGRSELGGLAVGLRLPRGRGGREGA
jgi:signal transduction histidine kinase